ncbi:class I SAM-dependent methyltransferase [Nocardia sp. NPDC005978]|uniref:class I SAM-dependent methyltransferase n=1 Tax=Nocardia sp. NPDC005978 TaxID=3156725 RepID=UPI0033A0C6DB
MNEYELKEVVRLEDGHWWYVERRKLLSQMLRGLPPGVALDVGAAGGGNTRVLVRNGWSAVCVEYTLSAARMAADRGLAVLQADARSLPVADTSVALVVAFDVLEHIVEDGSAVDEIYRALQPGGSLLVTVPADPTLWSDHDCAVGHVRRYRRDELLSLLTDAGFEVLYCKSWMVLLSPLVRVKRRRSTGSDLGEVHAVVNRLLRWVVAVERLLPLGGLPGVSLRAHARRPLDADTSPRYASPPAPGTVTVTARLVGGR